MAEKKVKSRIVHKHDTEANWSKATSFVPLLGEIIIYDIDSKYNYERIKIGDGETSVVNLPFVTADSAGSDYGIMTTGDGAAYSVAVSGIDALEHGVSFIMVPHVTSTATVPTLNVNGFGAKPIRRRLSSIGTGTQSGYTASWIAKEVPFRVVYDGTSWIVEGLTKPAAADLYGTVQIAKGGTGATDAETALANLGAVSVDEMERLVGETPVAEQIRDAITTKSDIGHGHDDRYYTETEIDSKLEAKADADHTHDFSDVSVSHASTADIANAVMWNKITDKPTAYTPTAHTHKSNDITDLQTVINDSASSTLDSAKSYTNSEMSRLVGDKTVSVQISTAIAGKADSNHIHDDRYYTETEINTKLAGKSDTSHTHDYAPLTHGHVISDVTNLQTILNAKVPTSRTVNGKALSSNITLTASDVKADSEGSASAALESAKSYTNAEIAEWVGDETVAEQISTAIASKSDIGHTHTAVQVGADPSGSASSALSSAKSYTDTAISKLINSAPTTLDTLGEIATAMKDNADVVDALEDAIGTKANVSDLTSHTGNKSNPHGVSLSQLGVTATATELNYVDGVTSNVQTQINNLSSLVGDESVATQINDAIATKSDSNHTHSGYVNQNAFSNVKVGTTTIVAETTTDTLTLVAGSNVTITPDATYDKVTIAATDTVYTHPITSGNKHIPSGGSSGQILRWSSDGTAVWGADNNTTYNVVTIYTDGLMSATDKATLNQLDSFVGDSSVADQINSAIDTHTHSSYVNQNAFSNIKVGNTTVSADAVADTLTLVAGNNVTLTPDTINDKITITATDTVYTHPVTTGNKHIPSGGRSGQILRWYADGTATWGEDNNTTYGAATTSVSGLMSAEDKTLLGNLSSRVGDTAVATQINNAINALTPSSLGITATATELNYVDGVTSNVQTQLNGKSDTDHTHSYAGSSSVGGAANSVKSNIVLKVNSGSTEGVSLYTFNGSSGKTLDIVAGNNITLTPSSGKVTITAKDTTYNTATTSSDGLMSAADKVALNSLGTLVGDTAVSTQISNAVTGLAKSVNYNATLSSSGWSGSSAPYTQTVTVSGMLATDTPIIDVNMSSATTADVGMALLEAWACVSRITTSYNTITAYCYEEKPTVNIPMIIKVVR